MAPFVTGAWGAPMVRLAMACGLALACSACGPEQPGAETPGNAAPTTADAGTPDAGGGVVVVVEGTEVQLTAEGRVINAAVLADELGFLAVWSQVVGEQWSLHARRLDWTGQPTAPATWLMGQHATLSPYPTFGPGDLVAGTLHGLLLHEQGSPPAVNVVQIRRDATSTGARLRFYVEAGGGAALWALEGALRIMLEVDGSVLDHPVEDESAWVRLALPRGHHLVAGAGHHLLDVVTRGPDGSLHVMACAPRSRCGNPSVALANDTTVGAPPEVQRVAFNGATFQVLWSRPNADNQRRSDLFLSGVTVPHEPTGVVTQTVAASTSWHATVADLSGGAVAWVTSLGGYNDHVRITAPAGDAVQNQCSVQPLPAASEVTIRVVAVASSSGRTGVLWADARHQPANNTSEDTRLYFRVVGMAQCGGQP